MIIEIKQTKSNFENKFEIKVNNQLKYLANTPWMDISIQANIDNIRPCIMTNTDESVCYTSSYNIIENISNSIVPIKWAFTGKQKSSVFSVMDNEKKTCGKFYKLTNGLLDTKYVIEYENYTLKCYDISVGKTRNIPIYNEENQIAEIIKPLNVSNNQDNYYIFLLDEYSSLETILSFFVIIFDNQQYSNKGQVAYNERSASICYTYDKNRKYYNKNWIINNFDNNDINLINTKILEDRENVIKSIKKQSKYVFIFIPVIILLMIVVFSILYYFNYNMP